MGKRERGSRGRGARCLIVDVHKQGSPPSKSAISRTVLLCLDPIQVRRMFGSAASIVLLQDTGC